MEGDDLELFERSLAHAVEHHSGAALDAALEDLGWLDALAEDRRAAVSILFELQGRANATSSALALLFTDALRPDRGPGAGVVLPTIGRWDPPGSIDDGRFRVSGLAAATLEGREIAVVVAGAGIDDPAGELTAFAVPTASLTLSPVAGLDPGLGLLHVDADLSVADLSPEIVPAQRWTDAVDLGRLALARELVGGSRRMLELAQEHALERVQFGRPISSFQAIRHRLAETLVAVETAEAAIDAAWLDGSSVAAAMAKAVAGRGARTAARHCQQVLAGIGFTTEHPLHLSIRRTLVLDGLLGTSASLTRSFGEDLIATRRLPATLPL